MFLFFKMCYQSYGLLCFDVHQGPWALRGLVLSCQGQVGRVDISKLGLRSASLVPGTVCAGPAGHAATPHCFARLAKLKSFSSFFHPLAFLPSFLPSGWQPLTRHMCITFLSIISAMTAALTWRRHGGPSTNLCSAPSLSHTASLKLF